MKGVPNGPVRIFPTQRALDDFMLGKWEEVSRSAVRRRGRFAVALSGGRTPVSFYERLAFSGRTMPWGKTDVFLTDERCVPADHPDRNYRMIGEKLLGRVPIPLKNLHPMPADLEPGMAAECYEKEMKTFFGLKDGEFPRFDLVLLGLGEDGHTASLFPGDAALAETRRLAVAVVRPAPDHHRISLTLPVINGADVIVFLVAGAKKAAVLKAVLEGPPDGLPAVLVRPGKGWPMFLSDREAGALLTPPPKVKRVKK